MSNPNDVDFDPMCDPTNPKMVAFEEISSAAYRIKSGVLKTPCVPSHLSKLYDTRIFLKCEFMQSTGSFKERGARNSLLLLDDAAKKRGVIAASAGNHSQGMSYHGADLKVPTTVVMPTIAPIMKVTKCINYGANVIIHGLTLAESKHHALVLAKEKHLTYINGYDAGPIIAGQGTVGLEILEQVPDVDAVLVPCGGGGLLAGVAIAIKHLKPTCLVYGVETDKCNSMAEALRQGKPVPVDISATIADGLAVSVVGVNSFVNCKKYVDKMITVTEDWTARSILSLVDLEKYVVEGGGAVTTAAIMSGLVPELTGKTVVCVLSGGNIDTTLLSRCLDRGMVAEQRLVKFKVNISDRPGGLGELCKRIGPVGVTIKDISQERAWLKGNIFTARVSLLRRRGDRGDLKQSFKERGARNSIILLDDAAKKRGVIAASSGNHSQGMSYHGTDLKVPTTVVMPTVAPIVKITKCINYGANVILHGLNLAEAKHHALGIAKEKNLTYINGYDAGPIIAGQGTVGLEILEQVPDVDAVLVPCGGGGLLAGVAIAVKHLKPTCLVYGVETNMCNSMAEALRQGKPVPVDTSSTLADGLAVSVVGVNSFVNCKKYVDKMITVTEDWTARSILSLVDLQKYVVEGAGAVCNAAIMSGLVPELMGKTVVSILSGGNIDTTLLSRSLDRGMVAEQRLVKFKVNISDRPGGLGELCKRIGSVGITIKDISQERAWLKGNIFTARVATTRLPLPTFSPRAVLMYSAAVGGEGAVALQLREAAPGELDAASLRDERLAIACHEPELLADLLHAASDIDGEHDGLTALLGSASPDLALASDTSDSLPPPDHDNDCTTSSSSSGVVSGITTVSVAVTGLHSRPPLAVKKLRPKPASPNRQGPQQCQVCNKIFGNASALAKHKLTHSDERKYVCITCAKAFKRQDHLNGHMLTHRNKKPYECKADGCGKSYCDARSLRRHTENHHQPPPPLDASTTNTSGSSSTSEKDRHTTSQSTSHRIASPISPARSNTSHSDSSNSGSEKSSGTSTSGSGSVESSPPRTPPAPVTPPTKPKTSKASSSKPKSSTTAQQGSQKCGSGNSVSGASSSATSGTGAAAGRTSEIKPVECNLCHRKFKNIPALNGHMRLHGGYFKKDSDNKKLDKKESTGPPLQTASVSVRALIEEKIISRRSATVASTPSTGTSTDTVVSRAGFVAPAPPPLSSIRASVTSPASPAATSVQFVPPRAPSVVTAATNIATNTTVAQRDSTLIELLKKGNSKVVKRSASDPGQSSPQQEFTFRPELFGGVSFNSDDGYFSPALNEDTFQFTTTPEQLEDLASLEDYATVAASIRERSPVTFPSSRRLAAVLNSPLPESLADFGACHGGSPVPSPGIGYTANSPGLSYSTGDSPGLAYTAASPGGSYSTQPEPSPGLAYPTPPASHDAQSPAHTVPRASSPLSAAFFTATMSSQEEVEEALEEVLPEECRSLDAYALEPSPAPRRIMLNSEDPLLSSSPRDFSHQRPVRRHHRLATSTSLVSMHQWQHDASSLQVCVEGRDTVPAVFLSPSSIPASPQRRKRRASPAGPYRSRMRRTVSHFVPQPILPPDRDGTGLFTELSAGLPTTETDVLSQLEEPRLPQINIGRDHQAVIPELCNDRMDLHRAPAEQLLWDPGINDILDDNEVRMFMELAMCAAMPVGGHTREYALQTLGECGGDIRAATLRLMSRPAQPSQHESRWTPEEVEAFLAGLGHYDKDFYKISQLIRTKDSKQCIQFYYFWKKVTKDYKTLYLRTWHMEQPSSSQGSVQVSSQGAASCTSSPTAYEGEEFPCKICGKVFNKVKSRSAHMKSHRPLDAEPKRPKLEKPYEKVERSDDRAHATADCQSKPPAQ